MSKEKPIVVDTVNDLTSTNAYDGQRAVTLGFYAAGDGGGREYYYDRTSTDPVDWVTTLDGPGGDNSESTVLANATASGTGTGRWVAAEPKCFNLKQGGCKIDGKRVLDAVVNDISTPLVITSATAAFTAADVGKICYVRDPSNADNVIASTIDSYDSATTVNIADAVTWSGPAEFVWGSDDYDRAQACIDNYQGEIVVPPGIMMHSDPLRLKDFVSIQGSGQAITETVNPGATAGIQQSGWFLGSGHPTQVNSVTRYTVSGTPTFGDQSVTLATPAESSNFSVGDVVAVISNASYTFDSVTTHEYFQGNKVIGIDAASGVIDLEKPLPFERSDVRLVNLTDNDGPAGFTRLESCQYAGLRDLRITAPLGQACDRGCLYHGWVEDVAFDAKSSSAAVNMFMFSQMSNVSGVATETAFDSGAYTHDSLFSGIEVAMRASTGNTLPLIAVGESSRNVTLADVRVKANEWDSTSDTLVRITSKTTGLRVENLWAGTSAALDALLRIDDDALDCTIDGVHVDARQGTYNVGIRVGDSDEIRIVNSEFRGAPATRAIWCNTGSTKCLFRNLRFPDGGGSSGANILCDSGSSDHTFRDVFKDTDLRGLPTFTDSGSGSVFDYGRKADTNPTQAIGTNTAFDLDAKDYDNSELSFTADVDLTLSMTRGGTYEFFLQSDAVADREVTILKSGATVVGDNIIGLPASGEVVHVKVIYDAENDQMQVAPSYEHNTLTVDGTGLSGTWTPDLLRGYYDSIRVTGVVPASVTIAPPTNTASNSVVHIIFDSAQANTPAISGTFTTQNATPDWTQAGVVLVDLINSTSHYLAVYNPV